MKESRFWETLRTNMPGVHWSRIENVAGSGIPDVNGCFEGKEVWLELKMFRGKRISLRNSQVIWMSKRLRAGGDVLLLARKDDEIWVIDGPSLLFMTSELLATASESGGFTIEPHQDKVLKIFHKPFNWVDLRSLVFGGNGRGLNR